MEDESYCRRKGLGLQPHNTPFTSIIVIQKLILDNASGSSRLTSILDT